MPTYQPATGPVPPAAAGSASAQRVRGVLDLCVLAVLAATPTHGYEVARRLTEMGIGEIKGGTLYPLLGRLETAGWLHADWQRSASGPPRKRYALTEAGHHRLRSEGIAWLALADRAAVLLRTALDDQDQGKVPP